MKWHLTLKTILAFLALLFICHEIHELTHTALAYWQCGCWGTRDFNAWTICSTCPPGTNTLWATAAGPVVTYAMIWLGWWLMAKRQGMERNALGFALVWANVPFARFITVLMKGGDEGVITRNVWGPDTTIWMMELAVVLLLIVPAIVRAFNTMIARRRIPVFMAFLILPMLTEFILMHKLGGNLLKAGVLAQQGVLGSPVLVNLWNVFWLMLLLFTAGSLKRLFVGLERKDPAPVSPLVLAN